jgi:hypothetical protein
MVLIGRINKSRWAFDHNAYNYNYVLEYSTLSVEVEIEISFIVIASRENGNW